MDSNQRNPKVPDLQSGAIATMRLPHRKTALRSANRVFLCLFCFAFGARCWNRTSNNGVFNRPLLSARITYFANLAYCVLASSPENVLVVLGVGGMGWATPCYATTSTLPPGSFTYPSKPFRCSHYERPYHQPPWIGRRGICSAQPTRCIGVKTWCRSKHSTRMKRRWAPTLLTWWSSGRPSPVCCGTIYPVKSPRSGSPSGTVGCLLGRQPRPTFFVSQCYAHSQYFWSDLNRSWSGCSRWIWTTDLLVMSQVGTTRLPYTAIWGLAAPQHYPNLSLSLALVGTGARDIFNLCFGVERRERYFRKR